MHHSINITENRSGVPRFLGLLLLAVCAISSLGCSLFNRQWNALESASLDQGSAAGQRWEGIWRSDVNGHEGKLRCIVLPQEADASLFRFSATWGPGIVSDYDIQMVTQPDGEAGQAFEGEMDLGWLMGRYSCKGRITGDEFRARYESEQDRGIFEMKLVR